MSDSRPTQKAYNTAILAADNWRKNHDRVNAEANYFCDRLNQELKNHVYFLVTGVMIGVLGTLLAGAMFSIH